MSEPRFGGTPRSRTTSRGRASSASSKLSVPFVQVTRASALARALPSSARATESAPKRRETVIARGRERLATTISAASARSAGSSSAARAPVPATTIRRRESVPSSPRR